MKIKKYVRKPFFVDAVQVTLEDMVSISGWCSGEIRHTRPKPDENVESAPYVKVDVTNARTERQTRAYVGDWVLRFGAGFKVYSDKAFKDTFQEDRVTIPREMIEPDSSQEEIRRSLRIV